MTLRKIFLLTVISVLCFVLVSNMSDPLKSSNASIAANYTGLYPQQKAKLPTADAKKNQPSEGNQQMLNPARDLLAKYNSARSYREFMYAARKVPEQGGYYYAMKILFECRRLSKLKGASTGAAQQGLAIELLISRCDISPAEIEDYSQEFSATRGSDSVRDPFLQLIGQLLSSTNRDNRAPVVRELLAYADPFSIALVASREDSSKDVAGEQDRVFLNGKWYSGASGGQMELAWQLAHCELGQDCGPDSSSTLKLCAMRGWCAASTYEAIRIGYHATDGSTFANILILRNEILSAIKRRDIDAFVTRGSHSAPRSLAREQVSALHTGPGS